ncbi:GNAT family N-acetyltransferase [Seonamhaeicola algicola]|nr:GNAT family N-acetyltransferase [Seonamhaeicola algicola]
MFGFTKEIKVLRDDFIQSHTELDIPFENVNFYTCIDFNQNTCIKLGTDENEIYGAIRMSDYNFRGVDYKMVERVCTIEKHRGKGIMKLLYSHCIENGFNLLSDSTHTTFGSKDFWIKAKRYFPEKNMYMVNLESEYKRLYDSQEEYKIWGKEQDYDFDLLEKEDKLALLDSLYDGKQLSEPQWNYFKTNIENLSDKNNIRLTIE